MSGALQAVFQNQRSFVAAPGQQAYTTAGSYSWVAPSGVTKVSVVSVGGGGLSGFYACFCACPTITTRPGGGGGGLSYTNNISVTPGTSYAVVVGATNGASSFNSTVTANGGLSGSTTCDLAGGAGGTGTGGNGGQGGNGCLAPLHVAAGGGGAGGYSGQGGAGGGAGSAGGGGGLGGAGGGGAGGTVGNSGGGGGVGILGSGSNGAGATVFGYQGGGGSGGGGGALSQTGGAYGGGTGNSVTISPGAVRIIWPGCARSFPSTRTTNE